MGPVHRGALFFTEDFIRKMALVNRNRNWRGSSNFIQRPFRAIIEETFQQLGLDSMKDSDSSIVGIHDFFQYRSHIFHKMMNRSWRMNEIEIEKLIGKLSQSKDLDDQVALAGLKQGLKEPMRALSYFQVGGPFQELTIPEKTRVITVDEIRDLMTRGAHLPREFQEALRDFSLNFESVSRFLK